MTNVKEILDRVSLTLQDPEFVRWSKEEIIDWISEAQVAIARTPGAYSKTKVVQLIKGTRQTIPDDGWSLLTVTRNFEGDEPRTPVRLVTRSLIDACVPNWHMSRQRDLVENYTYDDRFPREFFVYPPNNGEGFVEVIYMGIPAALTSEDQVIELDDTFIPALISYSLFRAFSKESDYAPGVQSAAQYFQAYTSELAAAMQARGQTTPNATMMPGPVAPNGGTE